MQLTTIRPGTLLLAVVALAGVWCASSPALASDYSDAITASAPIAWYRLGADANDSAGTHHGTPSFLGVTFSQTGAINNDTDSSVLMDPTAPGYITVPDDAALNFGALQDFSVEFWAKRGATTERLAVVNKGDSSGGFWMRFNAAGQMVFNLEYGPPDDKLTSPESYADDKWHHYVGVADRNNQIALYVDGQRVAEKKVLGTGSISTPGTDALLGYQNPGPNNPSNFWTGYMDEVAVYDTALTTTQVSNHFLAGTGFGGAYDQVVGTDSPIGWWRMADESDSGSGAHTCTAGTSVTFGQTTTIAGDFTGAAYMDGTDSAPITVANPSDFDFGTDGDFTIEAWVKVDTPGAYDRAMIFNKGDTTTSYWMRVQEDGTARFLLDYGSTVLDVRGGSVLDGAWHHVVGVANRTTGLELYIDSVLVDTQAFLDGNDISSTVDMTIGGMGAGSSPYDGLIDELAVYDEVLTEAEILAHYEAAGYSVTQIPGDANNSGTVDGDDAAILAANWGASGPEIGWEHGDFNDDDVVDIKDASIMAANWSPAPAEQTAAVPEPTVLVGLGCMAIALATARRRRPPIG